MSRARWRASAFEKARGLGSSHSISDGKEKEMKRTRNFRSPLLRARNPKAVPATKVRMMVVVAAAGAVHPLAEPGAVSPLPARDYWLRAAKW